MDGGGSVEITGYRDVSGTWNHLHIDPYGRGRWFTGESHGPGRAPHRHLGDAPVDAEIRTGRHFNVQVKHDGQTYNYFYVTPIGLTGEQIEADFKARLRAGYFVKGKP